MGRFFHIDRALLTSRSLLPWCNVMPPSHVLFCCIAGLFCHTVGLFCLGVMLRRLLCLVFACFRLDPCLDSTKKKILANVCLFLPWKYVVLFGVCPIGPVYREHKYLTWYIICSLLGVSDWTPMRWTLMPMKTRFRVLGLGHRV